MKIYKKLYQMGFRTTREVWIYFNHCANNRKCAVGLDGESRIRYLHIEELFETTPKGIFMKENGISFYRALQGLEGFAMLNTLVKDPYFRNVPLSVLEISQNIIFTGRVRSEILKASNFSEVPFHLSRQLEALSLYTNKTTIKNGVPTCRYVLTARAAAIRNAHYDSMRVAS